MSLIIDYREKSLIACINEKIGHFGLEIPVSVENLPIGDIIIKDKHGNEAVIIERKSLYDLASSIKDNRYTEQSFRLNECDVLNHNIIYLIEGNMGQYNSSKGRLEKKTLWSSMFSILYYKGFSVFRTQSVDESAECIIRFVDKVKRESKVPYHQKNEAQSNVNISTKEEQYASVIKRVKKNNINTENIGEIMLMQIPGVSAACAGVIMKEHKTIKNLIQALEENSKCLDMLSMKGKNDKMRKLTKPCIANIYNYLVADQSIIIS
jgi:ERCC4-type nuclease